MIGFATSNGYIDDDISAPLKADDLGAESKSRDRTLSPEEIKWFWHQLDNSPRLAAQTPLAQDRRRSNNWVCALSSGFTAIWKI